MKDGMINKDDSRMTMRALDRSDEAGVDEAVVELSPDEQPPTRLRHSPSDVESNTESMCAKIHASEEASTSFLSQTEAQSFRSRWEGVQFGFVDDPKQSVEQAIHLIGDTVKQLTESLDAERQKIGQPLQRVDMPSTEDLRLILRRYRSLFERLVSI